MSSSMTHESKAAALSAQPVQPVGDPLDEGTRFGLHPSLATPVQPHAAVAVEKVQERFELWFFRDMSDEQRLALFRLFSMPVDEIGRVHSHQRKVLRRILSSLSAPPVAGTGEAKPLRYCDYCKTWNSKPCGEQCVWTPSMPTSLATPKAPSAVTEAIQGIIRDLRLTGKARSKHCDRETLADALEAALEAQT